MVIRTKIPMRPRSVPKEEWFSTAPRMTGVMVSDVRLEATASRAVSVHRISTFFSLSRTASAIMYQADCHMLYLGFGVFSFPGAACL